MNQTLLSSLSLCAYFLVAACAPATNSGAGISANSASQSNIINGQTLSATNPTVEQRSVVMIQLWSGNVPGNWCTAVLIGENVGLTAAHCVEDRALYDSFKIVFGLTVFATNDKKRDGDNIVIHPKYKSETIVAKANLTDDPSKEFETTFDKRYDLAVFSFKGDLPAGSLPAEIDTDAAVDRSGQSVIVYGAGYQYHPKEAFERARLGEKLSGVVKKGRMIIGSNYHQYSDLYFTSLTSESHVCSGDSGGPQFLVGAKVPTIVGINSARLTDNKVHQGSICGNISLAEKVAPSARWVKDTQASLEAALNKRKN